MHVASYLMSLIIFFHIFVLDCHSFYYDSQRVLAIASSRRRVVRLINPTLSLHHHHPRNIQEHLSLLSDRVSNEFCAYRVSISANVMASSV